MTTDDRKTPPTDDADCPLGARWASWTLGRLVNRGHVSPEECESVLQARRETGWRRVRPLRIAWSTGAGDGGRMPDAPGLLVGRRHAHGTLCIAGHSVLERTINAPEYYADLIADRLFEWEDFCLGD